MAANIVAVSTPPERSLLLRDKIIAFVNDDLTASALRHGLQGTTLDVRRGNIRHAIHALEANCELRAAIVDISGIDDPVSALEDLARVCPTDVPMVLIGNNSDIGFYRTMMQMGAVEYLCKPVSRDAINNILRPKLVGEAPVIDRGGHVVAICGAQGGAGATSLAVNLAVQLSETTKARVALLDLHLQGGETAVMLGVRPGPGLRIALEDPERADELFLERAAIDVAERVKLIAADEALNAELHVTEAGIQHVLRLLRKRFNYIVVDVPVPLTPAIQPVIALSRHVLVLLEAEVTGLRNARALHAAVSMISSKNKVFTVLNRSTRAGGLPLDAIIKGLEAQPDIMIPDLGSGMTQAVNRGVPAIRHVPKLRRYLAPIVREITGMETAGADGWFGRWFRRQ
ncbi:MAG TPA: AAA family ATPase [Acetobacteraceae bacterium]|jgi:pilus assembly protein CpaE|nr:AAA family ATPase [Acetobacteraceae bacterium]